MRLRLRNACAAAVGAGLIAAVLAVPATDAGASGTALRSAPGAKVVQLPTGDRVRLGTVDGHPRASVLPAERGSMTAQFDQFSAAGDDYVLPAEVRPLLGIVDRSLFDVSALASGDSARVPVTVTLARGAHPDVPGLTVTSRTATSATGYLAPSAALRAGLVRAARAALRPGGRAPASLFGGVTRLAAAGARPGTAHPDYPQVTLIIRVLDTDGSTVPSAFVGLVNTDSSNRFANFVIVNNGEARVSVPLGNYSAISDVGTFDDETGSFSDRILPIGDFAVTHDQQVLTFNASDATATPSVSTPRPAETVTKSVEFDRVPVRGGSLGSQFLFDGNSSVLVAPVPQVKVGTLHWLTGYSQVHSGTDPYSYDLSFDDEGSIPADQAKSVQTYQLAKVHASYYNDRQRDSQFVRAPIYPFQFVVFSEFLPLQTPVQRTEYVYGGPSAIWSATLLAAPTFRNPFGGFIDDDYRVYPQGDESTAEWLRGTLAPKPPEQTSGDSFYFCPDCRSDNRMSVELAPLVDTTPGHFGEPLDDSGRLPGTFSLSRGKTVLASGKNRIGAEVSVPLQPATYRMRLDLDQPGKPLTSTHLSTDITFRSAAGQGAPLPDGWTCDLATPLSGCTVLPILTVDAPLPTNLYNRMPAGDNSFMMTVRPFHGAGTATITDARVQMQIGDGSFHDAGLERTGNGMYRVTLHNPAAAAGQPVTLRISASDDAGDAITQTTTAAYLVAGS